MSMFKDFVLPPLVLTVIAGVTTAALVLTEGVTTPIIEEQQAAAADAARVAVLPRRTALPSAPLRRCPKAALNAYQADNGRRLCHYRRGQRLRRPAAGDGGHRFRWPHHRHRGARQQRDQGLGSRVSEHDFMDQYIGKDSTLEGVQAISGTTISSNAFSNAVKTAYQIYGELGRRRGWRAPSVSPSPMRSRPSSSRMSPSSSATPSTARPTAPVDEGTIIVTSNAGFAGNVTTAIGFDANGAVSGVVFHRVQRDRGLWRPVHPVLLDRGSDRQDQRRRDQRHQRLHRYLRGADQELHRGL